MYRFAAAIMFAMALSAGASAAPGKVRRIAVDEYRDRMKAGWIGQIAGVSWGAPTEFRYQDKIIPEAEMPKWTPEMINNAFGQDDLYVEMTFLRSMEQYGIGVSIRQAGIDFANSEYALWCANNAGRTNLRRGIAPPDSSHPKFNKCPNDIDYQIEADFSGLIAPGMPQVPIALGEKFGRLMNYGDGVYAGQFMGALYSEAFFELDRVKLVETALRAIPADSQYAEMVRDLVAWYRDAPADWQGAWRKCQEKYRKDPTYQKASNGGIDCKINGAYVLLGLLFGRGDLDDTITISCRAGMDSDCNPSSSAGVLFTTVGWSRLPARFTEKLDEKTIFSHTAYNFPRLLDVCEALTRKFLVRNGGRVERDRAGREWFVIPVRESQPSALELSWAPGPIAGSMFTASEKKRIRFGTLPAAVARAAATVLPGWKVADCGPDMQPGLRAEYGGKQNVLVTHPLDQVTGCSLTRKLKILPSAAHLHMTVGHDPGGDWDLIVMVDGKEILRRPITKATCVNGWTDVAVDLTPYVGKSVVLTLVNQPSGWMCEAAYWAKVEFAGPK